MEIKKKIESSIWALILAEQLEELNWFKTFKCMFILEWFFKPSVWSSVHSVCVLRFNSIEWDRVSRRLSCSLCMPTFVL